MADDDLDDDLGPAARTLRRGVMSLARRLRAERATNGLSLAKISVLGHLARRGELTPSALAAADRLRPQSLTRVLAELESDGLISRTRDAADGRQRRVALTPLGRSMLAADMRQRDEWLAATMGELLTKSERDLLVRAAELLERLADAGTATESSPGSSTRRADR
jgi:DNA-binding MarR family transcriptional regulator